MIIMELVWGEDLQKFRKNFKSEITEKECRIILKKMVEALHYLHVEKRLMHLDLSSNNFMIHYPDLEPYPEDYED